MPRLLHLQYRPDIDGLRAIAVLSVVGFHAFPNKIAGGFIGVDIFFVISGFLISSIILKNLEHKSFSLANFYFRRIHRIFPALILVMLSIFTISWFILLADEYEQLGKHMLSGAGFISNFILWSESGYFDNVADTKPMLHLWSLAIEEQFYIFWPFLLTFIWNKKWNFWYITISIIIISFSVNIYLSHHNQIASFYSPTSRFWELIIGGILAYTTIYKPETTQKYTNIQSFIGFILIGSSLFLINKSLEFPGWWALLPTLGTFFIISAGPYAFLNHKILSNKILVWFGLISYPLYLWHWPLLSLARIVEGGSIHSKLTIILILTSVALSWITYHILEKPIRFGCLKKQKTSLVLGSVMLMVSIIGFHCYYYEGYPLREYNVQYVAYSQTIKRTERQKECFDIPYAYSTNGNWFCRFGNKDAVQTIFAYGDSHALSLLPTLEMYAQNHNVNILFTGTSGCPPLLGIQSMRGKSNIEINNCQKLNERIFNYIKNNNIKTVLLIGRWSYYTGGNKRNDINFISMNQSEELTQEHSRLSFAYGINKTIKEYEHIGVNVYLIEDNPHQSFSPKDILRKSQGTDDSINQYAITRIEHKKNQFIPSIEFDKIKSKNFIRINFDSLLCNGEICPLAVNGKFLYFDDNHLSIEGAKLVYPALKKALSSDN